MKTKNIIVHVEKEKEIVEDNQSYIAYLFTGDFSSEEIGAARLYINEKTGIAILKSIFIVEKARNQGVGTFLLKEIESFAKMHDMKQLTGNYNLFGSIEEVEKNYKFYEKNGYTSKLGIFFAKELQ